MTALFDDSEVCEFGHTSRDARLRCPEFGRDGALIQVAELVVAEVRREDVEQLHGAERADLLGEVYPGLIEADGEHALEPPAG
jgi:hypothetical protein